MDNKVKIYLSGACTALGKENFEMSNFWREQIKQYCLDKYYNKAKVFNPNDHFNYSEEPTYQSEREVMELDLYHLRNCDVVLHYANNPKSLGTMAELAIAYEAKKPIITVKDTDVELHPWIECFSNRIFDNLEDAYIYIGKHYIEV